MDSLRKEYRNISLVLDTAEENKVLCLWSRMPTVIISMLYTLTLRTFYTEKLASWYSMRPDLAGP